MIAFKDILTTAETALEAETTLALVPVVTDLGFSDKLVELHLSASGVVIALQPIFGWAPLLTPENEGLDIENLVKSDMSVRVWINPQSLAVAGEEVGDDSGEVATGNVTLSDGSTINLWTLFTTIILTIANIDGGETARAYTPTGGTLTQLNDGAMCYELTFDVRCRLVAEE